MRDPYLVDSHKFDLRCYVLVTSYTPLQALFFGEGMVRFAATPYSQANLKGGTDNRDQWMTNTFFNKQLKDVSELTASFAELRAQFVKAGHDPDLIFRRVKESIVGVLMMMEPGAIKDLSKVLQSPCPQCYQVRTCLISNVCGIFVGGAIVAFLFLSLSRSLSRTRSLLPRTPRSCSHLSPCYALQGAWRRRNYIQQARSQSD